MGTLLSFPPCSTLHEAAVRRLNDISVKRLQTPLKDEKIAWTLAIGECHIIFINIQNLDNVILVIVACSVVKLCGDERGVTLAQKRMR